MTDISIGSPLSITPDTEVIIERDPLTVDLPDEDFLKVSKKLISDSEAFYESKYNLKKRRIENKRNYFGRQLWNKKMYDWESDFNDNILWEGMAYLKPIALSKMPDIVVYPGPSQDDAVADGVTKIVDTDIKSKKRRTVLSIAFKHRPVYFVGCIKPYWNPEIGESGDFDFRWVHPENLILDHTCPSNDVNEMSFVAEYVEYTVKELVMRWPKKEQELYEQLRVSGKFSDTNNEKTEKGMNTKVKIVEIWFTWWDKAKNQPAAQAEVEANATTQEIDAAKWERVDGVGWYYEDLVFDKIRDPNWDWEGKTRLVQYGEEVDEAGLREMLITGDVTGTQQQQVFNNYFENPRKPYILLNYDQWGEMPLDETSEIEQGIPLQRDHNKRGKQLTEMLDNVRGTDVWSDLSGLKKEDIEEKKAAGPRADMIVEGNPNEVHHHVEGDQPTQALFSDKDSSKNRIFAKMGVNGAVRGEPTSDVATNNQISREGDFTRADDLTEETINNASVQMAEWELQFIKLRYTEDHFRRAIGQEGSKVFKAINQDMVDDGMEISISASSSDKLKAKQQAFDLAKLGPPFIDPLTFFKDIGASDPKGRVEKGMMFSSDPNGYFTKFVLGIDTPPQMAQALTGKPQPGAAPQDPNQPPAQGNMTNPQTVGPVSQGQQPSPGNTQQVQITPPQPQMNMAQSVV